MRISIYILVILAGLFVALLCALLGVWAYSRLLKRENDDLNFELVRQKNLTNEYQAERDIALARAKSHCSFWELRKDERIEELEAENRAIRESMQEV